VDGSPFFDPETQTWHYLSQSIGKASGWSLSHFWMNGSSSSPTDGEWVPNPNNPVVLGGALFASICNGSGKHCLPGMVDEGTPDIVMKQNGSFYVTFHGYDYGRNLSARGIAKTMDFVTWVTHDEELPGDVIFSSIDCNNWKINWAENSCVGGGAGWVLKSGDYFYQLIEAPDISLLCLGPRQNWVFGLLRSPVLWAVSGTWEQFGAELTQSGLNPIIVPALQWGCALQYDQIFQSEDSIYLSYWYYNNSPPQLTVSFELFRLVPGADLFPMVATTK